MKKPNYSIKQTVFESLRNLVKSIFISKNGNKYIIFLLLVYVLSRLLFLSYRPHWDSAWYWQLLLGAVSGIKNVQSLGELFDKFIVSFNFLGHPSMAYATIVSLGQFINYNNVYLLNITNLLLSVLGIWGFYRILYFVYPKKRIENLIMTWLFAFNPLSIATSISFNLDFPLLIFEIMVFYALIYGKRFQLLFWSLLLIFSKETGVLIYLSLTIGFIFFKYIPNIRHKYIDGKKINITYFVAPLIVFIIYLLFSKWNFWNPKALENTGNVLSIFREPGGFFGIAFDLKNISTRLFQIFVMNFQWLLSIPICIWMIRAIILKKQSISILLPKDRYIYKIATFVFIIFVLINLFYVVMPFSRYTVAGVFYLYFIGYFVYLELFRKRIYVMRILLVVFVVLEIIQVFYYFDPSPSLLFGTNYIGSNKSSPVFGYHDGTVYNTQFTFISSLSDKINSNLDDNDYLFADRKATYYFDNININSAIEDLNTVEIPNGKNIKYLNIPWFENLDQSTNIFKDKFSAINKKEICNRKYCAILLDLKKQQTE